MNAKEIFNAIPKGHQNALKRPAEPYIDRNLRKLVEEARTHGRLIINNGEGYFEVDPHDEIDVCELKTFLNKQKSRIRRTAAGIRAMEYAYQMTDQYDLTDEEIQEWRKKT